MKYDCYRCGFYGCCDPWVGCILEMRNSNRLREVAYTQIVAVEQNLGDWLQEELDLNLDG